MEHIVNDFVYNIEMLSLVTVHNLRTTYTYTYNPTDIDKIFNWLFSEDFSKYTDLDIKYKITRARYNGIDKGYVLFKGKGFHNCIELNLIHLDDNAFTKVKVFRNSIYINTVREDQIGQIIQFLLDMFKYSIEEAKDD